MATRLTPEERKRLIELIDLLDDDTVTQLDTDEVEELNVLWEKLSD